MAPTSHGRRRAETPHPGERGAEGEPTRTRRGGRPSRRTEILSAAVDLFASGGTRGTSLEAIAREIGVTKAAITHHFGTKEALLREVAAISDLLDGVAVDPGGPVSGLQHLSALRTWGQVVSSDHRLANLARLALVMTVEAFDPAYPARDDRISRFRQFRAGVARIVAQGQDDGSISGDADAHMVAAEVIAFMEGTGVQWYLDPEGINMAALFDHYFDRLVADLSIPASRSTGQGRAVIDPAAAARDARWKALYRERLAHLSDDQISEDIGVAHRMSRGADPSVGPRPSDA